MTQIAHPTADTTVGNWTTDTGATTGLFAAIDETVENDADYVQSELAPAASPYVAKLGSLEDPVSSTGHSVSYAYQKNAAGGAQIDLTVELRQGYVSEASQGTLIASWSHTNIPETVTPATQNLTGTQADAITDYTALYLRFVANQV